MKIVASLKNAYVSSLFRITPLSIFINPFYLIRRGLIGKVRQYAHVLEGEVLDFGCGRKPYREFFLRASKYVGLDVEDRGHSHEGEQIDVMYDGVTIPFEKDSFDGVFSSEVLEHVPDVDHVLEEWQRVLRPGGKVLATVPFVWEEHELPYDFRRFTRPGLVELFKRHGFEVERVEEGSSYFDTVWQMLIMYVYGFFPKHPVVKMALILLLVFPLNCIGALLSYALPSRSGFCNNLVFIAKKHA